MLLHSVPPTRLNGVQMKGAEKVWLQPLQQYALQFEADEF